MSLDINLTGVEITSNKKTTLTDNSDTFYPTQKAVKTAVDLKQNTLGFTPENVANLSTDVNTDQASNSKYPSVKAVFDWAVGLFVQKNTAITGATKTKITYDAKGLVTAGADATTADIADSSNKRYVTDANLTVIGNTSGTNTGDQTLSGLGGVPTTRTVNGYDLSANRTLNASDVGAVASNTAITPGTYHEVTVDAKGLVTSGVTKWGLLSGNPNAATGAISGSARYYTFADGVPQNGYTFRQVVFVQPTIVKFFAIVTITSQPASGNCVFTVQKNGVDTGIVITVASGSASGTFSETATQVSFSQFDTISVKAVNNASATSCVVASLSIGIL